MSTVVIGLGNGFRRDDGVGLAVAAAIEERALPDVDVLTGIEDPASLLDAWAGAALAVLVDAAVVSGPASSRRPGRVHRVTMADVAAADGLSSHQVDVAGALALGEALGRVPDRLVVFTVAVADVGHGAGLTPAVAAAVPAAVTAVVAEIADPGRHSGRHGRTATSPRAP